MFGHRIKIIAATPIDNKEGLYAVALKDGTATKFPTAITNMPSQLIYLAPSPLAAGDYKLEVRTYSGGNNTNGKTLKVIDADHVFTVKSN